MSDKRNDGRSKKGTADSVERREDFSRAPAKRDNKRGPESVTDTIKPPPAPKKGGDGDGGSA